MIQFIILIISSFLISITVDARPKAIILLRHAEKPLNGPDLSKKGWLRAKALPEIFNEGHSLNGVGRPDFMFAAGPVKQGSSMRSIQTLKYLSEVTGVSVDKSFNRDQYTKMTSELFADPKFNGKTVLICWQHDRLTDILQVMGYDEAPQYPSKVFDRIWLVTFDENNNVNFKDLPQKLLPGDSLN